MRWVRDETGRVPLRPHFRPEEIDQECESLLAALRRRRGGPDAYPLTTDDLTVLLERAADDLDLFADLSADGQDTEGVTEFLPGGGTRVRIAAALSESPRRAHRLRSTLAHELGHVRLHACLWTLDVPAPATLNPHCQRAAIERPTTSDWLEWQAGYASGAVLMPARAVAQVVAATLAPGGWQAPLVDGGTLAGTLLRRVARAFDVSRPAARVRLLQLGHTVRAGRAGAARRVA